MTLTEEQRLIIRRAEKTDGIMLVKALAGTGKTHTLQSVSSALPDKYLLYVAFSKDAQRDAEARGLPNTEYRTFHSLGYAACGIGRYYRSKQGFSFKLPGARLCKMLNHDPEIGITIVKDALTLFCQSDDAYLSKKHIKWSNLLKFESHLREEVTRKTVDAARLLFKRSIDTKDRDIVITPQVYLKYWQLNGGKLPVNPDLALIDESQDLNPVILSLVRGWNVPTIYVGDPNQSIYKFTGAVDAMDRVQGDEFYLTKCWRFGQGIADVANKVLALRGGVPKMIGNDNIESNVVWNWREVKEPHTVLCRTNSGLLEEVLQYMDKGRSVAVVGSMKESIEMMESVYGVMYGVGSLVKNKDVQLLGTIDALEEAAETNYDIGMMLDRVRKFGEETPELCDKLKRLTTNEDKAEVIISTAHKSKGRQWPVVKLSSDFKSPIKKGKGDTGVEVSDEELNLTYVAATRAQKTMYGNSILFMINKGVN